MIFILICVTLISAVDFSHHFNDVGNNGLSGGINCHKANVGNVHIGGNIDNNGHTQGVYGGVQFGGPNHQIDINAHRGRGGASYGGNVQYMHKF